MQQHKGTYPTTKPSTAESVDQLLREYPGLLDDLVRRSHQKLAEGATGVSVQSIMGELRYGPGGLRFDNSVVCFLARLVVLTDPRLATAIKRRKSAEADHWGFERAVALGARIPEQGGPVAIEVTV